MADLPDDTVSGRIKELVDRAAALDIEPHRLERYAELHAISELRTKLQLEIEEAKARTEAANKMEREKAELRFTRAVYGLTDDFDEASLKKIPGQARQQYQRISESARSASEALRRFAHVLDKNCRHLPKALKLNAERQYALKVADRIDECRSKVQAPLLLDKAIEKLVKENRASTRTLKTPQRTLLLWHRRVCNYPRKWNDMHDLAKKWNISKIKSTDDFKRYLRKLENSFS